MQTSNTTKKPTGKVIHIPVKFLAVALALGFFAVAGMLETERIADVYAEVQR